MQQHQRLLMRVLIHFICNEMQLPAIVNVGFDTFYLQRLYIFANKLPATIVWLMRARNMANTKYIYWRSPRTPSSFGIQGIIESTVESVGSVYEEI
jgi:hypothetical protein